MTPERWHNIEPLLNEALDLSPDKRNEFLTNACNGKQSLRLEIEALLAQEERAHSFIEEPILPLPNDLKQMMQEEPPKPALTTAPLTGKQLGKYKIRSLLGKGAMGEVYLAYDAGLDREVALKFLPPDVARDPEQTERFKREARTLAKLENHPNIAVIHDLELSEPTPFLVLEYVPGQTLAERLQQGAMPLAEALPLFQQIAAALTEAQKRGIIHRDLKPANIKITPDGRAKVLDFGLAKILGHQAQTADLPEPQFVTTRSFWTTDRQVIMGTVPYMSPEQTRGLPLDQRTDIWAFGCVLFESLTGQRPFRGGDTFDLFHAIRTHEPDWQLLPANTTEGIRNLLRQCLRKEPETRLASAREAFALLLLAEQGKQTRTSPFRLRLIRWKKQLVLAIVTSLMLGVGVAYRQPLQTRITTLWATQTPLPLIPKDKALVILPFKEAGSAMKEDKVGRGLAKTLQEILASIADLRVLPFIEATQANLANASPQQVIKSLGVNLLLSGEVQRDGEALAIHYWVQDQQGRRVLSGAVKGHSNEYSKLQNELAAQVAKSLQLNPANLQTTVRFKNQASEEPYLQAVNLLQTDLTSESLQAVITSLLTLRQQEGESARVLATLSQAYFQKALLTANGKMASEAVSLAERAVQADAIERNNSATTIIPEIEITRGQALIFLRDFKRAIESFQRVRKVQLANLDAIFGLARAYQYNEQWQEAEETYQSAAVIYWPNHWLSHNELGAFYFDQGRYEKALQEWQKTLALNADSTSGYVNIGNVYIRLGQFGLADNFFDQAARKLAVNAQTSEDICIGWGTAQFYLKNYQRAEELYREGLQLNQEMPILWANLGDALRYLPNKEQEAFKAYSTALSLIQEPQLRPVAQSHVAELVAKRSRLSNNEEANKIQALAEGQKAQQLIGRALRSEPQNIEVLTSAILVYELTNDRDKALDYLKQAWQQVPSLAELEHHPDLEKLRFDPRYPEIFNKYRK